jgi:hypothetical protein
VACLAPTSRETVILGLYYRSLGFCRTAIELKSVVHQQLLTSAEHSVVELYVDMELVHRNAIPDAVEKFNIFTDHQKLKAARRIDTFFAANPALDTSPKASVHREFIANNAARIDADVARLWGTKPEHWSGLNLIDRSKKLDKQAEYLVIKDYDRRNFSVHTGLAGVVNLNAAAFTSMAVPLGPAHALGVWRRWAAAAPHPVESDLSSWGRPSEKPPYPRALFRISKVYCLSAAMSLRIVETSRRTQLTCANTNSVRASCTTSSQCSTASERSTRASGSPVICFTGGRSSFAMLMLNARPASEGPDHSLAAFRPLAPARRVASSRSTLPRLGARRVQQRLDQCEASLDQRDPSRRRRSARAAAEAARELRIRQACQALLSGHITDVNVNRCAAAY